MHLRQIVAEELAKHEAEQAEQQKQAKRLKEIAAVEELRAHNYDKMMRCLNGAPAGAPPTHSVWRIPMLPHQSVNTFVSRAESGADIWKISEHASSLMYRGLGGCAGPGLITCWARH